MNLPVPNAEEVEKFRELYLELRGEELDDERAYDLALRFLQFYYFASTPPPDPTGEIARRREARQAEEGKRLDRLRKKGAVGIQAAPEADESK